MPVPFSLPLRYNGFVRAFKEVFIFGLAAIFLTVNFVSPARAGTAGPLPSLNKEQRNYFSALYRDTWNYLGTFVEPLTGLPYDSSARQPATSMTNAGLYLASVAAAYRTELIPKDEAAKRIEAALGSIAKVETWRGIPRPWILVKSLKPTFGDEFTYAPHLASLIAGLLTAKSALPELAEKIDPLLLKMELKSLYDPETGWLKGGYHVKTKTFAIYQPWGHWYYKYFASETRLLSFYLMARRLVPAEHWARLLRPIQEKEGEKFLVSGYEEAGLLTQYLPGIFLDERDTEMGGSQRAYARAQMKSAERIKAPVWGGSACTSPKGRYLTAGELREDIVAPYASVLTAIYFPKEAYENLKALERLGARPSEIFPRHPERSEGSEILRVFDPQDDGSVSSRPVTFGFRDSLNWKTGEIAKVYLTVDQALIFLSLANLLHEGAVWQTFAEEPAVQKGLEILKE